jgi:hypothetical protein
MTMEGLAVLTNPGIGEQVEQRIVRLANRLARACALGTPYGLKELVEIGDSYRAGLAGERGERYGEHAARLVLEELVDDTERLQPEFWRTALGRACAWWIGSSDPYVPRTVAAAVLNCSRQNIHEMTTRGTLATLGDGVEAGSLRDALRRRVSNGHT